MPLSSSFGFALYPLRRISCQSHAPMNGWHCLSGLMCVLILCLAEIWTLTVCSISVAWCVSELVDIHWLAITILFLWTFVMPKNLFFSICCSRFWPLKAGVLVYMCSILFGIIRYVGRFCVFASVKEGCSLSLGAGQNDLVICKHKRCKIKNCPLKLN